MICKKCGANIENNSKFCGICGEMVEEPTKTVNSEIIQEQNINLGGVVEEIPVVEPLFEIGSISPVEQPVEQTAVVEPVMSEPTVNESVMPKVEQPVEQTAVVEPVMSEPTVNESVMPKVEQPVEQTTVVEPVMSEPTVNESMRPSVSAPEVYNVSVANKESKKKSKIWIFVVLGVLLGVIALVLIYFSYSKFSNDSVKVLEKALGNMLLKSENSGTIDAKLSIQSDTEDTMNLSAAIKYAKQGDDNYNFNLTLNKSMFFDEMNVYASILDDRATLFVNSSLIDMLGLTSATPSMWVYMTTTEQELETQTGTEIDELADITLSDFIDDNHFKLIGEQNNLTHYQLVIDNELINKIKLEASKKEELKNFDDSLSELTQNYYVDFYINNSDELVKISMDLTNSLNDESIRSAIVSFEFNNLGSTLVEIPTEAQNSIIDLETYISTYTIQNDIYVDPSLNQDYTYQY